MGMVYKTGDCSYTYDFADLIENVNYLMIH